MLLYICSGSDVEHCSDENWNKCAYHPDIVSSIFAKACDQVPNARYQNYDCDQPANPEIFTCLNRADQYPLMFDFDRPPIQGHNEQRSVSFRNQYFANRE